MKRSPRGWLPLPLALLTGACMPEPWTPAAVVSYSEEPVPEPVRIQLPPQHQAMDQWLLPPDHPWAPWTKATLLSALDEQPPPQPESVPDIRDLELVRRAQNAADALARDGVPSSTLWIVDLRGAASVAFVATLSAYVPVAPVLTFNNWPADEEVVPAEETLAALLLYAPVLPKAGVPATPVFALDSWRLAYRDEDIGEATDNRYALTPSDFPTADQLAHLGIRRVVYLVERWDAEEVEEEDVHDVFAAWTHAGIAITMMDLETLSGETHLETYVETHQYFPVPRLTIIASGSLHTHSPGGFGGPSHGYGHPGSHGGWHSGGG